MGANAGFIISYILTGLMGICLVYDIKHNKDVPFFLMVAHVLLFISNFYWSIYYGFKLWTK